MRLVYYSLFGVLGQKSDNMYFIIANRADPDEMLQYVASHLGLHRLLMPHT